MKKLFKQVSVFAVVAGLVAFVGLDAHAIESAAGAQGYGGGNGGGYSAGSSIYNDIIGNLTGTGGTTIGLLISLFGLYMWIWNQVTWGIIVAIAGGLLTAFPGIYTNIQAGTKAAFEETVN